VTVKIDVISVLDQDIIGSRSFEGSVSEKKKGGGYEVDRSGGFGGMDGPSRAAMETLENPAQLRENEVVIAGQD